MRHLVEILSLMKLACKGDADQQAGGPGPADFAQKLRFRAGNGNGDQRDSVSRGRATLKLQDANLVRTTFMVSWKEEILSCIFWTSNVRTYVEYEVEQLLASVFLLLVEHSSSQVDEYSFPYLVSILPLCLAGD